LVTDIFSYCARELPLWNTVSISGYHIREAGSTAVEEVAFTLADGIAYVEAALARGLAVDDFAPRLAFFFNCHNNFLEEVAKFRAARKLWAAIMKERFGAKDERSMMLRFHTQTAGSSLAAQQPYNNIIRTTIQAMAAVCGGTQSLHTNGFDEALGLPTEDSARIALRTQQVIAEESGLALAADPLGGSYLIESWTTQIETNARALISKIDELGGMLSAIEKRFPQEQIEASAYKAQRAIEDRSAIVVGVNRYEGGDGLEPPVLAISSSVEGDQRQRLTAFRAGRDSNAVAQALNNLRAAASSESQELMPLIVNCVRDSCTLGEISDALRDVFGEYRGG
jgi:methylmalonyl-CoA mutase N-terminal domain/subunit